MSRYLFPRSGPKVSPDFLRPAAEKLGWTIAQLGTALGYTSKSPLGNILSTKRQVSVKMKEAVEQLVANGGHKKGLPAVIAKTKRASKKAPPEVSHEATVRFLVTVPQREAAATRALLASVGYQFQQVESA